MPEYTSIRRITVYAARRMEEALIPEFLKRGSTGYTSTDCRGGGEHPMVGDPLSSGSSHVRIELLVQPEAAETIMDYLEKYHARNASIAFCMETVDIVRSEKY